MKTYSIFSYALILVLGLSYAQIQAQCSNNNYQYGSSSAPTTVGQTTVLSYCMYGGEYRLVTNMQAGSEYSFETCGDTDFDTQITVYDHITGQFIAYNDDFCGFQSKVTFVSNGNPVRILIDRYFCSSQSSCMTLRATRESGGAPAPDPCNSVVNLSCGNSASFSLNGTGAWNTPGPWPTPGAEQVYSFTATVTGSHVINVTNSGYYVDLFIKSNSCSPSGWTYVDDISTSANNTIFLNAGTTYYFLIEDENTSLSTGSITVNCPTPATDPCTEITNASCDNTYNYALSSGNGLYNGNGPWSTPGKEKIYSYTAPVSGSYTINMTNNNSGWVDLFYKSGACGGSGWTYIDDVFSSSSNTVFLTGGVTYLFLLDDEDTNGSTGSFEIECPCIGPPNGIDGSYTISSNTSISGNTDGACNDCSLRSSEDQVHQVVITCPGTYTFSTCNNASWDTYLYLTSGPCSGVIASNDDNCSLRSRITTTLAAGTYYLVVEGFSSSSSGAYSVDISRACDLSVSLSADVKNCGYNVSCNGSADGSISANVSGGCNPSYSWSNGGSTAAISGLPAGTYILTVNDGFGCSATAKTVLTEPDPLVVDAGSDEVVYYGYGPLACADLEASATGGCANYLYSWSNGDFNRATNVCPQTTTDYTVEVTDANGCTASDVVTVCAVDVTCSAGNSNNQKVEVCHIPPGNPGNAHTICVDASAVPAHLAIGCQLGACDELANTCGSNANRQINAAKDLDEPTYATAAITAMPNPFDQHVDVSVTFPIEGDYSIVLLDIHGRVVKQIHQGNFDAFVNQIIRLETKDIASGVYVVAAMNKAGFVAQTSRIVKQ